MGAYHQMGHHSENLLSEKELDLFVGALLSPVNYPLADVIEQVREIRLKKSGFDVIFDPQLYVPQSERGQLPTWPHFPDAVDTSDIEDHKWWNGVISKTVDTAGKFAPNAICSPAPLPKVYTPAYYNHLVRLGADLAGQLKGSKTRPMQTLVVSLADLTNTVRALEIASIASKAKMEDIYLIFETGLTPRREISEGDGIRGAMVLIAALSKAGFKVLVGFSSSDVILWKAAGAASAATGKFFNLRRFTRSRWDEAEDGGQNMPYWFEEALLAFVRDSDLIRLRNDNKLSAASLANPIAGQIFAVMDAAKTIKAGEKAPAWVRYGWRQYMYWFADAESRIQADPSIAKALLKSAEQLWLKLEDEDVLMVEPRNNGSWIRIWRRAQVEFEKTPI